MALSVPPASATWDRTLPNPASLLSSGIDSRRSSSLLQHHISSDHFLTPAANESARRNTVPCIVSSENDKDHLYSEQEHLRQRQESIMSVESPTESSSECTSLPDTSSGYCLCVPDPKIPRPRNAFILYRQNQHADVVKAHPGLPNPDISKIIGEQWRHLSVEEKNKWKAFAEQEKARHSQQFPDYRYRPKRSGKNQSEGTSQPTPAPINCAKCGGKTINPPHTPQYPPFDHSSFAVSMQRPQKRPYPEAYIQARPPSMVQVAPAPYTGPVRYGYQSQQDSLHYGPPSTPQQGAQHALIDAQDAKRRRLNTSYTPRPPYDHQRYDRERPPYAQPEQLTRHPVPPPVQRPSQGPLGPAPLRPIATGQSRRDPSLTLPPLQTGVLSRPSVDLNSQTQKSSVEAMIMSYPVLNKLKTLQSIAPVLGGSGPSSSPQQVRGMVIAIEGLDQRKVLDMTHSLAEQLEKEGKFLVRTFTGPSSCEELHVNRRMSLQEGGRPMTTEKYLHLISDWHKLSKEVITFVTHKPGGSEEVQDHDMPDAIVAEGAIAENSSTRSEVKRSPISAISPKTITQTNQMSLDTPKTITNTEVSPRITRSRIPQAALDQQKQEKEKDIPPRTPPPVFQEDYAPSPSLTATDVQNSRPEEQSISHLIPVALIPHYQLTIVDTCSIALPITDNYDALTHWRWLATLWRGCLGSDISVVIRSAHEQFEDDTTHNNDSKKSEMGPLDHCRRGSIAAPIHRHPGSAPDQAPASGAPPGSAIPKTSTSSHAPMPFGVEVRLQDYRAVIVRAAGLHSRGDSVSDSIVTEKDLEKENENWEKAKRRVGFEVEEWMRR